MTLNPAQAMVLLAKCRGDEIWSVSTCQEEGVPAIWIEELADAFESGFDHDRNTIYENQQKINQYHGVSDLQLAIRLAEFLGVDTGTLAPWPLDRRAHVRLLQEAVDEN
ncbi:MAG: hypothetical protein VYE64_01040 [Planctomycetota bacterium]|nr:hypothetical protein [Planctomycetota bacterium]